MVKKGIRSAEGASRPGSFPTAAPQGAEHVSKIKA